MFRNRLFVLWTTLLLSTLQAGASELPGRVEMAGEIAALPGGHWLALNEHDLSLIDGRGDIAARIELRGAHLDSRATALGAMAVVFDENEQHAVVLDVNLAKRRIDIITPLPRQPFSVKSLCLYRDRQQLDHLYLIGRDGQAEQWLLSGPEPRLLRQLALPPGSEHCRVDDRNHSLYVSEESFGVWSYPADGEGVPGRTLVTARPAYGQLSAGAGALAVLPDGLAVLDAKGENLILLRQQQGQWSQTHAFAVEDAEQLLVTPGRLSVRTRGGWQTAPLWWPRAGDPIASLPIVQPHAETMPVTQRGDSADDPAIWVNPLDHSRSRVLVTDKKQGLLSYDLQGGQQQFLDVGRINNVDLRQQVRLDGRSIDLALATQRDENALVVFEIDAEGNLRDAAHIPTAQKRIYGLCLYQPVEGGLEVFVNDKSGTYVHYRITADGDGYAGEELRRFKMRGLAEGCVVDDRRQRLFIAEEEHGIWALAADASVADQPHPVLPVGQHLTADVEGLAIYYGQQNNYLIASSQGDSSFAVLDASPPFSYRGSFRIGINLGQGVDGVSDTDGLEATALDFGGAYGEGMLIVQDGYNQLPDSAQNFKYVPWRDIARALHLPK
ncbi:MAG: 3-phytase [gamma proteobacterium symbiont of Ctena orbiculata]|nr:MAG: 3-phytase [gamma proteobacterium symbiont of Ctena orbiculata]